MSALGDFTQVAVTARPVQILAGWQGTVTIVNQDTANVVTLARKAWFQAQGTDTLPVQPLSGVSVDAARTLYASAPDGTQPLLIIPGSSQWAPSPGQIATSLVGSTLANAIAAAIQQAGVPPIDKPAAININLGQTVTAGSDFTSIRMDVSSYQSLIGTIFAQEKVGGGLGTNPFYRIRAQWSLQSDNFDPLITQDWVGAVGPFSFVSNYRHNYSSPCFGDTLTLTFHNYDSKDINLIFGIFGSYRTRSRAKLQGRYPDDLSAEATGLSTDGIILNQTVSLGAGLSTSFLCQLWDGSATIYLESGSARTNPSRFDLLPEPQSVLNAGEYQFNAFAGSPAFDLIAMPRRVCTLKMTNNDVGTHTHRVLMVAQQGGE